MARRNLVVVRGGDRSLHRAWMSSAERSWDLCLSYYGGAENPCGGTFDRLHRFRGAKWPGLSDLLASEREFLSRYDYVWFPDDDLMTDSSGIDALFAAARRYEFDVCQPALTPYSFASHRITLQRTDCLYRITNFVEIMAPMFSARALHELGATFSENSSGWGLEWLWDALCKKNGFKQGIIDEAPVFHTRPVGAAGHGGADSTVAEMNALLQKYGLTRHRATVLMSVHRPGGSRLCAWLAIMAYRLWTMSRRSG